jgi:DNA-binding transcriptional LysR family regulator
MDRVSSMLSFVKVVEHNGFSSAARQLNLATSVVTTHVKSLEERLGVRLLNRTTRSVCLTEAGKAYYEPAFRFCRRSKTPKRSPKYCNPDRAAFCASIPPLPCPR